MQRTAANLKTRFIVNNRSGRAAHALPFVRAFASSRGAELVETTHPRHATALAIEAVAKGCELIVAVGGDGTMNEVAGALIGTPATLGLVPCGSGDGLGRHLRIHGPIKRALHILEHGATRLIDSGVADGHPFFTVAGVGFEAEIAKRFNTLRHRGFFQYLVTSIAAWPTRAVTSYTIACPTRREIMPAFTVAVANANQYGNNARIAPRAQIDDGALDLTAIPPANIFALLPLGLRLFNGRIDTAKRVWSHRAPGFTISAATPMLLHTDGEVYEGNRTVEFSVRPASLRIRVPTTGQ